MYMQNADFSFAGNILWKNLSWIASDHFKEVSNAFCLWWLKALSNGNIDTHIFLHTSLHVSFLIT